MGEALHQMPHGTVFFTVPWMAGIERAPGGQLTSKHMMILDIVERLRRLEPSASILSLSIAATLSVELVASSLVMLMELGRLERPTVRASEAGLFLRYWRTRPSRLSILN